MGISCVKLENSYELALRVCPLQTATYLSSLYIEQLRISWPRFHACLL